MKATELQIGDWVIVNSPSHRVDPHFDKVFAISYDHNQCRYYIETDNSNVPEDYIEPIPLTDEILKANGFVDGILPYTLCNTKLQLSIQNNNGFWAFSTYAYGSKFCDLMIVNVHEFQHALRLCELNDLADNFKIEQI